MNITFLIGNGFDLNLGLKTKYSDFYNYYLSIPDNGLTEVVRQFKKDLKNNLENWADLELAIGQYLEKFNENDVNDIIELLNNLQDSLADYIDMQEVGFTISEEDKKKLGRDLFCPEEYLTAREKQDFNRYKQTISNSAYNVNIVIFNYTQSFEILYNYENKEKQIGSHIAQHNTYINVLKSVEHIHGDTKDNMILGLNDVSQIKNNKLQTIVKLKRAIIKPDMNRYAGTLRDDRCKILVNSSDLICIFGMSIGETDKIWWQLVIKILLESNARLIIFSVFGQIVRRRSYQLQDEKDAMVDKLMSFSQLNQTQKDTIRDRIFVCFNSEMFNVKRILQDSKDEIIISKAI